MHYSTLYYRILQQTKVQYITVQVITEQYSAVQYSAVQYSAVQYSTYLRCIEITSKDSSKSLCPIVDQYRHNSSRKDIGEERTSAQRHVLS